MRSSPAGSARAFLVWGIRTFEDDTCGKCRRLGYCHVAEVAYWDRKIRCACGGAEWWKLLIFSKLFFFVLILKCRNCPCMGILLTYVDCLVTVNAGTSALLDFFQLFAFGCYRSLNG